MNSPDPCFAISDGLLTHLNPAAGELLGRDTDSLKGKMLIEFIHPDDLEKIGGFLALPSREKNRQVAARILCSDNQFRMHELHLFTDPCGLVFLCARRKNGSALVPGQFTAMTGGGMESEQKLKSIFGVLDVGILIIDYHGTVIECNDEIVRMTGLNKGTRLEWETIRDRWIILNSDLSPMAVEECPFYRSIVEKEKIRDKVMGIRRPNGEIKWISVNASYLDINGGGAVLTLTDITISKTAQDKVIRNEALFRSVFELPHVGIALVSHDMSWSRVNQTYLDLLGYTEEEFVKISWDMMVSPEDLKTDMIDFRKAFTGEGLHWTRQRQLIRKGGEKVWVLMSAATVFKSDKTIDYFIVVVQDISTQKKYEEEISQLNLGLEETVLERTHALVASNSSLIREINARKKTETELIETNTRLKFALEATDAGVWDFNFETGQIYLSEAFNEFFSITPGTIPDTSFMKNLLHPDDRDRTIEYIKTELGRANRFETELRIVTGKGGIRQLRVYGKGIVKDNKLQRVIGICIVRSQPEK